MKNIIRIATILLIILGTSLGPRAFSVDHFKDVKKKAIVESGIVKPFEGFFIDPNPIDKILFTGQENNTTLSTSTISIFNQCGCLVKQFTQNGETTDDKLGFLSPGLYYLKIHNTKGIEYRKILIN